MQKAKKPCIHDPIQIDDKQSLYSYHHFFHMEGFPSMDPFTCNDVCREKMKLFFQFKTEQFSKWAALYYEDFRNMEDIKDLDRGSYIPKLSDYYCFFSKKVMDEELQRPVLQMMKVGLLGGKPVRLCDLPEGAKCDFDASNLEEFDKANE